MSMPLLANQLLIRETIIYPKYVAKPNCHRLNCAKNVSYALEINAYKVNTKLTYHWEHTKLRSNKIEDLFGFFLFPFKKTMKAGKSYNYVQGTRINHEEHPRLWLDNTYSRLQTLLIPKKLNSEAI